VDIIISRRSNTEFLDKTVKPPSFTISRISLQPPSSLTKPHHTPTKSTVIGKLRFLTALAVSPRKDWLVAIDGDKVFTWPLSSTAPANAMRIYSSPENLTCLAFHPSENYFATGDAIGQIRLWYCLQNPSSSPAAVATSKQAQRSQTKVMHWHAHAVASLTFTPNGAYLLSGGEEAVLVIWELASGGFKKEFVPRVGSAIEWVSTNLGLQLHGQVGTLEYVLGLEDGTTVVVNAATLKVSKSFSGLKLSECCGLL
jgi:NET1-associated nuclear protein 1 (U3 small nucleolar RNA-associated protein 17)